jgi:hypothetical protein|tara:strand:+ start:342 stop:821 length:480 start_codon:yes stop_codon:yes gene_type:complete
MNSNFRRDYAYITRNDIILKATGTIEQGTNIRYLRYDRRTKSYLFVTGARRCIDEQLIVVGLGELDKVWNGIKKLYKIPYERTNMYDELLIMKPSQLELCSKYNFTSTRGFCLSDSTLELVSSNLDRTLFSLDFLDRLGQQRLDAQWLSSGHVIGLLAV